MVKTTIASARKAASNPSTGQESPLPYTQIEESDISKATNRFTTGTTYDEAGEVVVDAKFRGMGFGYDANGRMVKATKTNVPDALSVYDAAGMRVAERVNDVWRFSVYDIGGKLVAEYGGPTATDEGGVKYLLSDWQGSNRAILSNTGNVLGRMDYTAYGEDIASGVGLRTQALGYSATSADSLRQRYGLTERDDATGLDHTWFRKHENRSGRWTSPDPYNGSISVFDPQSFNRYNYVNLQPTNFVDPSGLLKIEWCTKTSWRDSNGNIQYTISGCVTVYDDGGGFGDVIGITNTVREELKDYLRDKSQACQRALKAMKLTDKKILLAFDKNIFKNQPPRSGSTASTDFGYTQHGNGPKLWTTTTSSIGGVGSFLGQMGLLIHELAHAALHLGDGDLYANLLKAQKAGQISGLAVLTKPTDAAASDAISNFLNKACPWLPNGVDPPMPAGDATSA